MPKPSQRPVLLEATSPVPLPRVLRNLREHLEIAGVWIETTHIHSPSAASLLLESHVSAIPALYAALLQAGAHLSSSAHIALSAFCSCAHLTPSGTRDVQLNLRFSAPELGRWTPGQPVLA